MRSSSGEHWLALDHVRALAAFLVFSWHFLHGQHGAPVPFGSAQFPSPLAILDEGHTGVALFMTLSGYLFAKLVDGRTIDHRAFLLNRVLRLAPLALLVMAAMVIARWRQDGLAGLHAAVVNLSLGLCCPLYPLDGGLWSIVVEAHFYLLLPALVALGRRRPSALLLIVAAALLLRLALATAGLDVQRLAYWTLVGRIDQFVLGMAAFGLRHRIAGADGAAAAIALAFVAVYAWFDRAGGAHPHGGHDLGRAWHGLTWVVLPTIEGGAYAALIAWYDARGVVAPGLLSRWIGKVGAWSYSIYLLHFFIVFRAAAWIDAHVMSLADIRVAIAWSLACFAAMVPLGWLGHRLVERPFLRHRRLYLRPADTGEAPMCARQAELPLPTFARSA